MLWQVDEAYLGKWAFLESLRSYVSMKLVSMYHVSMKLVPTILAME